MSEVKLPQEHRDEPITNCLTKSQPHIITAIFGN